MLNIVVKLETGGIVFHDNWVWFAFTVPEDYVGEEMEVIAFTRREGQTVSAELLSPALQGSPLTNQEFVNWINQAEMMPTISLDDAKSKWTKKRQELQQLIK